MPFQNPFSNQNNTFCLFLLTYSDKIFLTSVFINLQMTRTPTRKTSLVAIIGLPFVETCEQKLDSILVDQ